MRLYRMLLLCLLLCIHVLGLLPVVVALVANSVTWGLNRLIHRIRSHYLSLPGSVADEQIDRQRP